MSTSPEGMNPTSPVAQLLLPGTSLRSDPVATADVEHAATVVAHLLHRECAQWSWSQHHPEAHHVEARRIVGALCREGWSPS